jgi:PAS domain S-box-containing protein
LHLGYLVTTPQSSLFSLIEQQEEEIARQQASLELTSHEVGEVRATVQSLLDSATSTVLIAVDPELRVTHFSAGAQHTLGYEPGQVLGNEVHMLVTREEVARQAAAAGRPGAGLQELLEALASSGARGDWSFRTASGEPRMLSINVSPIDTDHGVIGRVLAGEDVTERLHATQALAEALEREQQSLARLQSADQLRNDLVSTVSHELSTPLTSIAGYLEMLQESDDGGLSAWQQDALDRALRNTVRLRRLVDDLRLIAQVDTGGLHVEPVELDLRAVVESCRDQVGALLHGRDLALRWEVSDVPVRVHGDLQTLREVVLRLAGNAVKFTPDGGSVGVTVAQTAEGGVLAVSDTGIGIRQEDQRRIFGRFERGSEVDKRAIQGVGLGLSIVSTVVRRHGGRIDVDSAPDQGTTIRVVLPAADRSVVEQRAGDPLPGARSVDELGRR